jgi:Spy/CpxP family protein refolding chaperone
MKLWILYGWLMFSAAAYAAEADTSPQVTQEPTLHDHYVALKQMQERLAGRSLDEQAKIQPQIQRAQQKACARLRKDHQERIPRDEYRRQGGDEFLVFSLELEQWCATLP